MFEPQHGDAFETAHHDGREDQQVVVILEAGSRWSVTAHEARRLAPNSIVLSQGADEGAAAFAARVERRLLAVRREHGRAVRAAVLCAGAPEAEGQAVLEGRARIRRALGPAAADGCTLTLCRGDGARLLPVRPVLRAGRASMQDRCAG